MTAQLAVAFLVDARGHVLLQHRDEGAPRAANQWGMVGGHVEPGEEPGEAVHREIEEETGIETGPGTTYADVALWLSAPFTYSDGHHGDYWIYTGRVDLTDADIIVGEGRAIVFVDPHDALGLDLAESTAHFLPRFLDSDHYRRLTEGAP